MELSSGEIQQTAKVYLTSKRKSLEWWQVLKEESLAEKYNKKFVYSPLISLLSFIVNNMEKFETNFDIHNNSSNNSNK
jgi:hypothetical protein